MQDHSICKAKQADLGKSKEKMIYIKPQNGCYTNIAIAICVRTETQKSEWRGGGPPPPPGGFFFFKIFVEKKKKKQQK